MTCVSAPSLGPFLVQSRAHTNLPEEWWTTTGSLYGSSKRGLLFEEYTDLRPKELYRRGSKCADALCIVKASFLFAKTQKQDSSVLVPRTHRTSHRAATNWYTRGSFTSACPTGKAYTACTVSCAILRSSPSSRTEGWKEETFAISALVHTLLCGTLFQHVDLR